MSMIHKKGKDGKICRGARLCRLHNRQCIKTGGGSSWAYVRM